jgi:hypothetical protein
LIFYSQISVSISQIINYKSQTVFTQFPKMKALSLLALFIACFFLAQETEAFRGGFGGRGFGFGRFGYGGFGWGLGWGLGPWGFGGLGFPWWGRGRWGREIEEAVPTFCKIHSKANVSVSLSCKNETSPILKCDAMTNLNPAWKFNLSNLTLIPVDHTAPVSDFNVKILSGKENGEMGLNNFTTIIDSTEMLFSLIANEKITEPGFLIKDVSCWSKFIDLVMDTKLEQFHFSVIAE